MDKSAEPVGNFAGDLDWNDIRNALAIARLGTLAAAARALGVDQTTVARRLRILESCVGAPLFERHKGRFAPTPAGQLMVLRGERIEQEVAALRHLGADMDAHVRGAVRLTAVDAIVSHYLAGHLAELRARHPQLNVELIASSRSLDLNRREADIALRLARPQNGDLAARRLARLSYAVYGATTTPPDADWDACHWVAYEHSLAHTPEMRWLAERGREARIVFRCNNMDALATAVANGIGIGILPCLIGARHAGLRRLSGDAPVILREIWLVAPMELRHAPRISAVSDWLAERFRADARQFG